MAWMMVKYEASKEFSALRPAFDEVNNTISTKFSQIDNLEREIQEKRRQLSFLEKQIIESNEASISNTSLVDMQQKMMRLMTV